MFDYRIWRDAFKTWTHAECDQYSAAIAYFLPFALTPLVFISLALVGMLVGTNELITILANWGAIMDPTLPALIEDSLIQFTAIINEFPIPFVAILFFSWMILVTLNSVTAALHAIWGVDRHGWRALFSRYTRALLFVGLLQMYFVVIIISTNIVDFFSMLTNVPISYVLTPFIFLIASIILFALAYRILPLWAPSWRSCVVGATVAGVLFTLIRLIVAFHFATAPTATLFGAATVIVVVLVWFYACATVILYGAAFAKIYDIRRRLTS